MRQESEKNQISYKKKELDYIQIGHVSQVSDLIQINLNWTWHVDIKKVTAMPATKLMIRAPLVHASLGSSSKAAVPSSSLSRIGTAPLTLELTMAPSHFPLSSAIVFCFVVKTP
jgi:hypothetical protein